MIIKFLNKEGQCIKSWSEAEVRENFIPMLGDNIILTWGDESEEPKHYMVVRRYIYRDVMTVVVVELPKT